MIQSPTASEWERLFLRCIKKINLETLRKLERDGEMEQEQKERGKNRSREIMSWMSIPSDLVCVCLRD